MLKFILVFQGSHTLKWVFRKRCFRYGYFFLDKAFIRSITLVSHTICNGNRTKWSSILVWYNHHLQGQAHIQTNFHHFIENCQIYLTRGNEMLDKRIFQEIYSRLGCACSLVIFKLKKQSNRSWLKFRIHGNLRQKQWQLLAIIRDFGLGLILAI